MTQQLLSAHWIIPVEPQNTVLEYHTLVIEGGCIKAILPTIDARQQFPQATETKLDDHALIPGLVNLHTHAAMTLMRGMADDTPLMVWLNDHIWPVEAKFLSENYVHDGTELACAEMIRSGTTCFADMYFYQDVGAKVVKEAGMRAALGGAVIDFPTPYAADADAYIARGLASRDMFAADPFLKLMLTPHAPYTVSDETFRKLVTIANEMDDITIMCHIHETAVETTDGIKAHGVRPIARLEKLGVLNSNLIAVHCVHVDESEVALFKQRGVHVAHCPTSNLKLGSGFAPINAMVKAGVNVGIGTDGCASNNRLDMFAETRLASLLQKGISGDAAALPALQALEMATLNGAKALQWDKEIGSLLPGKAADIVAVNLGTLETQPCYDAASHLWYAAGRENVSHVWVNGELLLDKGALTRVDINALKAKAATWGERFRSNR